MLPTFVIGLREGLEAALIVGIVAAFLRQRGRTDLLRRALLGVAAALVLCIGVGAALQILSANLPQRKQEGLETVVGTVAVVMVTYMVVWMRRHSRDLRGQLEGAASEAIASGSGWALVSMAFLAVLREGFETAVFLLAAFNESDNGASAGGGAALGIGVAMILGYGIYRGGVHINLSKFFRATGLVLVVVAAGLVVSALHTAHEAGWLNTGQRQVLDLTSLTHPGSVSSSLLTGMLGIQDRPTQIEVIGWLLYLVPLICYVAWPVGRPAPRLLLRRVALIAALGFGGTAAVLAATLPSVPAQGNGSLTVGTFRISAADGPNSASVLRVVGTSGTDAPVPATLSAGNPVRTVRDGVMVRAYRVATAVAATSSEPASATLAQVAALNGGRLPLGTPTTGAARVALSYTSDRVTAWWVQIDTGQLVDITVSTRRITSAVLGGAATALGTPTTTVLAPSAAQRAAAASSALGRQRAVDSRTDRRGEAIAAALATLAALGAFSALTLRRRPSAPSRSALVGPPQQAARPEQVRKPALEQIASRAPVSHGAGRP